MPIAHGLDLLIPIIMLASAVLVTSAVQRLHASPILGYLLAGLLIGPSGVGLIQNTPTTQFLAELGVVFLLFAIGLELPLERLRVMRHWVFGFGGASTLALMSIFGGLAYYVRGNVAESVVIAAALAFSSTALLLQLLSERGEFATRHGRASFSAALFQDLAVVPLLVAVPLLNQGEGTLIAGLSSAAIKAVFALVVIMYLGKLVLRPFYRIVIGHRNHELFTAMTLLVVLTLSLTTFHFGLSLALGAFLAGVILSETEFRHQIAADIEPFRGLLLGLFFMTVGMMINLDFIGDSIASLVGFLVLLIGIKLAVFFLLARAFGLSQRKSMKTAILLSQGGEFAFVLLGLAMYHHLIGMDLVNMVSMVVIISMVITPILMRLTWPGLSKESAKPASPKEAAKIANDFDDKNNHIVILGFGRVGQVIAEMCALQKLPYIVIDDDNMRISEARARGYPVFYGDATKTHVLRSVGVDRARAVVVAVSVAKHATRIVHTLRENWPNVSVFGRARDSEHAKKLVEAGVTASVPITLNASLELGGVLLQSLGHSKEGIESIADSIRQAMQ